jgi:hypothetical protein
MHDIDSDAADLNTFAVVEQTVELPPVGRKIPWQVVKIAKHRLDFGDASTDAGAGAELILQIRHRRQVIGMNMGIENPLNRKARRAHMGDEAVGELRRGPGGGLIVVENRIDDGGRFDRIIDKYVRDRKSRFVKERLNSHRLHSVPLTII